MSYYSQKPIYDHIYDKWVQKDGVYQKANYNRDMMAKFFRSDELISTDDVGNLQGQEIYNGSGSHHARTSSVMFQGLLVSKTADWIRYAMEDLRLKGVDEVDQFEQDAKEHMTAAYKAGNFYDIQPKFTLDGMTTGSPVIFGEEDLETRTTMWMPQHYKNTRLYYDKYNRPEGCIIRDKTWTAKKIFDTFIGDDDDNFTKSEQKLSIAVVQALRQAQWGEQFTMFRAVFKAPDPIWNSSGEDAFVKPTGFAWLTAYFLELTAADGKKKNTPLNDDMGDNTRPFSTWDFDKTPWDTTSTTPAFYALWDTLSLQQLDKNYGEDLQYATRPSMMYVNTMENNLDFDPEGHLPVSPEEYKTPPVAIDRLGRIQFNLDWMNLKDESVRRYFFIDKLTIATDLARTNKQPVSATQMLMIDKETGTLLSPAIESHSSYLEGIDDRMVGIEYEAGRGPFNRRNLANLQDVITNHLGGEQTTGEIRPVFIGQLAKAQKVAQTILPIQNTLRDVAALIDLYPRLKHRYDAPKLAEKIEEARDFPQDVIRPDEEYEALVQADAEAAAAQQQQENQIELMKASKGIQGPVDDTSILAKATG